MTNSYGLNPTLNNPEDLEGLADIRTEKGAARCCQFVDAGRPPAWYFFSKESKTYPNDLLGLSVVGVGNWKSNISKLYGATVPTITDAPKETEVLTLIENKPPTLRVFDDTLNMVGYSVLTGEDYPTGEITPDFIGQTYLDTFNLIIWVSVGLTSNGWIQIGIGGGS